MIGLEILIKQFLKQREMKMTNPSTQNKPWSAQTTRWKSVKRVEKWLD